MNPQRETDLAFVPPTWVWGKSVTLGGLASRKGKNIIRLVWVAGVAQLVEHNVANVVVVGSNPITRSFLALCIFTSRRTQVSS